LEALMLNTFFNTINEIVRKHLNFDSIDFKRNNHITI